MNLEEASARPFECAIPYQVLLPRPCGSLSLEVANELCGHPFPIGAHGRQRRAEVPHLAGERALA